VVLGRGERLGFRRLPSVGRGSPFDRSLISMSRLISPALMLARRPASTPASGPDRACVAGAVAKGISRLCSILQIASKGRPLRPQRPTRGVSRNFDHGRKSSQEPTDFILVIHHGSAKAGRQMLSSFARAASTR
jgi:hypothetical protein